MTVYAGALSVGGIHYVGVVLTLNVADGAVPEAPAQYG